jgi:hypothetical protein
MREVRIVQTNIKWDCHVLRRADGNPLLRVKDYWGKLFTN